MTIQLIDIGTRVIFRRTDGRPDIGIVVEGVVAGRLTRGNVSVDYEVRCGKETINVEDKDIIKVI